MELTRAPVGANNDAVDKDEDSVRLHLLFTLTVDLCEVRVSFEVEPQVATKVLQVCKPEYLCFSFVFQSYCIFVSLNYLFFSSVQEEVWPHWKVFNSKSLWLPEICRYFQKIKDEREQQCWMGSIKVGHN